MSSVPSLFELAHRKISQNLFDEMEIWNMDKINTPTNEQANPLEEHLNETINKIVCISKHNKKQDNMVNLGFDLKQHLDESINSIVALSNVDTNDGIFDEMLNESHGQEGTGTHLTQHGNVEQNNVVTRQEKTNVESNDAFASISNEGVEISIFDDLINQARILTNTTDKDICNDQTCPPFEQLLDTTMENIFAGKIHEQMHSTSFSLLGTQNVYAEPTQPTSHSHFFDDASQCLDMHGGEGEITQSPNHLPLPQPSPHQNHSQVAPTRAFVNGFFLNASNGFNHTNPFDSNSVLPPKLNTSHPPTPILHPNSNSAASSIFRMNSAGESTTPNPFNISASSILRANSVDILGVSSICEPSSVSDENDCIGIQIGAGLNTPTLPTTPSQPNVVKGNRKNPNPTPFCCDACGLQFFCKSNLNRHQRRFKGECAKKEKRRYMCSFCSNGYTFKKNLSRHIEQKHKELEQSKETQNIAPTICSKCDNFHGSGDGDHCVQRTSFTPIINQRGSGARRGQKAQHQSSNQPDSKNLEKKKREEKKKRKKVGLYHCHNCENVFPSKAELYEHYMLHHNQHADGVLQSLPWEGEENAPWHNDGDIDVELQRVYEMHSPIILKPHETTPITSLYNFPINNLTVRELFQQVKYIYQKETRSLKMNIAFGFILKNIETGKLCYFKPYMNQNVLEYPISISVKEDMEVLYEKIKSLDIINHILQQRENTKNKIVLITNVLYTIFPFDFNLGGKIILPPHIKNSKSIIAFDKRRDGVYYDDHFCFFRCLVAHFHPDIIRGDVPIFSNKTKEYFERWKEFNLQNGREIKTFTGVKLRDIAQLELCFGVNINIFSLCKKDVCCSVFRSVSIFDSTMNLNQYENHLSYITNIASYTKKFICSLCKTIFKRKDHWKNHEKSCDNKIKLNYVGGFYSPTPTIFEELENYGISIPLSERKFEEFVVFDMEAMLTPISLHPTKKLSWTHEHIPISVALCSNVDGFTEPICIVNDNCDELVGEMVDYMKEIADVVRTKKLEKFENVFKKLHDKIEEYREESEIKKHHGVMVSLLEKLCTRFEKYCFELPVLGFNSGRYDINLIKSKILQTLQLHKEENFIVKKNNNYVCISNGVFKFLDITQFLSPGTSYSSFLKSFEIEQGKGFFPYEYLTCKSKLTETSLPPIEKWWSSLKNKNVLEDGVHTIEENYLQMENVWEKENMKTLEDFLRWYNKLDVYPFVSAVQRLCKFYFDKGIDLFKETISVPGVSRKMLFKTASKSKSTFSLIDHRNKDLYHTIHNNVVGGPSIIFNRTHKKDKTYIRNNTSFPCKKIIGFDANALYLWAIDQQMPAGGFIRRNRSKKFKPQKNVHYSNMFYWMDWLNFTENTKIKHYQNNGKEVRIGPYLVDGYDCETNTIYQFQGCYYHGHTCHLVTPKNEKEKQLKEKRKQRTEMINSYLKEKKYNLVEMYECEFSKMKKKDEVLRYFISSKESLFTQKYPQQVDEKTILEGVMSDLLFGLVEVDISVPNSWDEVSFAPNTNLPPKEYFEEMSPIFGNAEIPFEKIGETMQDFITNNDLSKKPRRLLIGAMKAEQILLATPLLKWYINHGLKVTKVHQTVEYANPSFCFNSFVEEVSSSRRQGDIDQDKSTLAETFKLIGNSAFGSMIMNKMRHKKISYVDNYESLSKCINNPKFEKMTEISDEFYEIESSKNKVNLDLPTLLGFWILQLAKLRMLEFYYDFVDKYVKREHFQYCEMDTDSAYMAIAKEHFDDVIKPSMKEEYEKGSYGFCVDSAIKADSDFHWFPRRCCTKHKLYDKRTPGLFKVEFEGDEIIGLCSKTYIVKNEKTIKFSSKGVNKHSIKEPMKVFENVLQKRESGKGSNVGFRVRENRMSTYSQEKNAFSYLYCKRKLLEDGISTLPLDITISPYKKMKVT
jgi:G:T-mismatch repair DNA endonuclease (very short patch repair protein)